MEKIFEPIISFEIKQLSIRRIDARVIPSGNINYIYARFAFSNDWEEFTKTAIFSKEDVETVQIPIVNGLCKLPNNFMEAPGIIYVSVFGGDRRVVDTARIEITKGGFQEGIPPVPSEPTNIYVQSPEGSISFIRYYDSAFQYFTKDEWKTVSISDDSSSLLWYPTVDENGNLSWRILDTTTTPSAVNILGPQGVQGLTGEKGDVGPQGIKGDIGLQGIQGEKGDVGPQGPQGVQGIQGEKGDVGPQGIQGERGEPGPKGDSYDPADVLRINALESNVSALQIEIGNIGSVLDLINGEVVL